MTPSAAAKPYIDYEKAIANWASGNDSGGRDASARLVTPGGVVHYKVLFRAYDEIVHVYDNYQDQAGAFQIDYNAVAHVRVYHPTTGAQLVSRTYSIDHRVGHQSNQLGMHGEPDIPEGYKIQLRVCQGTYTCTPWVYGKA